jgi:hypothetical protein
MNDKRIQIGYGSDTRSKGPKGGYGSKKTGKVRLNGGFNYQPVEDFHNIPSEKWDSIFPDGYKPSWLKNN